MKTHVAMLYGEQNCKIQHNTINIQNTNENTTTRATNEDKFSKNTSGNVARLNAGEGRRRRQNKRRRRSLIRLGWTLTHVRSHWSSGDVDFPFKVFIVEHVDINPL